MTTITEGWLGNHPPENNRPIITPRNVTIYKINDDGEQQDYYESLERIVGESPHRIFYISGEVYYESLAQTNIYIIEPGRNRWNEDATIYLTKRSPRNLGSAPMEEVDSYRQFNLTEYQRLLNSSADSREFQTLKSYFPRSSGRVHNESNCFADYRDLAAALTEFIYNGTPRLALEQLDRCISARLNDIESVFYNTRRRWNERQEVSHKLQVSRLLDLKHRIIDFLNQNKSPIIDFNGREFSLRNIVPLVSYNYTQGASQSASRRLGAMTPAMGQMAPMGIMTPTVRRGGKRTRRANRKSKKTRKASRRS